MDLRAKIEQNREFYDKIEQLLDEKEDLQARMDAVDAEIDDYESAIETGKIPGKKGRPPANLAAKVAARTAPTRTAKRLGRPPINKSATATTPATPAKRLGRPPINKSATATTPATPAKRLGRPPINKSAATTPAETSSETPIIGRVAVDMALLRAIPLPLEGQTGLRVMDIMTKAYHMGVHKDDGARLADFLDEMRKEGLTARNEADKTWNLTAEGAKE